MKHCAWLLNTGAIFSAKEKKKPNNTRFHRVNNLANTQHQVYVKATRDIATGTEILFPYQKSYQGDKGGDVQEVKEKKQQVDTFIYFQ
jgi:SET domain-containing protein